MKPDGFEYYEYIFCYVEDVLCISHNPQKLMNRIQGDFNLKYDKIETPGIYLRAALANMKLKSGNYCWNMSPEQYVKAAVTNIEEDLARSGKILLLKCVPSLLRNYAPWLEDSPELMADGVQQYQELIGKLRWAVDIGRLGIMLEKLLVSNYLAMPRVGHLKQAFHIFGYLKVHSKRKLGFDPVHPAISKNSFQQCDWTYFYRAGE